MQTTSVQYQLKRRSVQRSCETQRIQSSGKLSGQMPLFLWCIVVHDCIFGTSSVHASLAKVFHTQRTYHDLGSKIQTSTLASAVPLRFANQFYTVVQGLQAREAALVLQPVRAPAVTGEREPNAVCPRGNAAWKR